MTPDNSELQRLELLREAQEEVKNSLLDRWGEHARFIVPSHVVQPNETELKEWLKDEPRIEFREEGIYVWKGDTLIHGMISGSIAHSLMVQDLDACRDCGVVRKSSSMGLLRTISDAIVSSELIPDVQLCMKNVQGHWMPSLVVEVDTENLRTLEEWYNRVETYRNKTSVSLYTGVKVWIHKYHNTFSTLVYVCNLDEYRHDKSKDREIEQNLIPMEVAFLGTNGKEFGQMDELCNLLRKWDLTLEQISTVNSLKIPTNTLYGPEQNNKRIKDCDLPQSFTIELSQLTQDIKEVLQQKGRGE